MRQSGLVHIYTGDGKGKTTCAVGLAARAAGHGHKVVFAQFLKGEGSGERAALAALNTVELMPVPASTRFLWTLTNDERAREADRCREAFISACEAAADAQMLILDEALSAVSAGVLSERALLDYLDDKPDALEVILTGRGATEAMMARADYVSIIECRKHPFAAGIPAREGVEY